MKTEYMNKNMISTNMLDFGSMFMVITRARMRLVSGWGIRRRTKQVPKLEHDLGRGELSGVERDETHEEHTCFAKAREKNIVVAASAGDRAMNNLNVYFGLALENFSAP